MTKNVTGDLRSRVLELLGRGGVSSVPEGESEGLARLLGDFVHLEFTEEEAHQHWERILENHETLSRKLSRKPSVHVAVVDYFTSEKHVLDSPLLVEVRVFRQAERLAMIDGLTGIFNRRYMDIMLKKEFNRCDRYGKSLSVCILDIDDFKRINDTRGHQFGDEVLRSLSTLIRGTIREEDVVCRYGGEEFLVILPETDAEGARALAERAHAALKVSTLYRDHGVTFSAGVATYPSSAGDVAALVTAADRALYQAKFLGKDRIECALPERRRYDRFNRPWSLDIYPENESTPITEVVAQNISLGGTHFECPVRYPVDTLLTIVFSSGADDVASVEARARISWVKKNGATYLYGVCFLDSPETLEPKLSLTVGRAGAEA